MSRSSTNFDVEEAMHLAVYYSDHGQKDAAIRMLKELVFHKPNHAEAHFLLAAQYAEIKLRQRAVAEYHKALMIKPDFKLARLQLCMLYLSMDDTKQLIVTAEPLISADSQDYFYHFAAALMALSEENFDEGKQCLAAGMSLNH
ncbi:MAG: hypothetical protein ACO2ZM_09595 [Francisellaceae bacterium]